jgi:hypothetical protein
LRGPAIQKCQEVVEKNYNEKLLLFFQDEMRKELFNALAKKNVPKAE